MAEVCEFTVQRHCHILCRPPQGGRLHIAVESSTFRSLDRPASHQLDQARQVVEHQAGREGAWILGLVGCEREPHED